MIRFSGDLFDGVTSQAHPVAAELGTGCLRVEGDGIAFDVQLDRVSLAPPVGAARGVVHLPAGRELHSADLDALARLAHALPRRSPERWARALENRLIYAFAALLLAVLIIFAGLRWGVPTVAQFAVHTLPAAVDVHIGKETLALMDKVSLDPSTLPAARQRALAGRLESHCRQQACPPYLLLFRDSALFGPNALALPGGTIIVTDELVKLAAHDEEILAVIAHELGHVERRHGLRLALQGIGAGVILVVITGDIGSMTDLAAGLPSLLLQNGYSRDMEREADAYALAWLQAACIPSTRFADILARLDKRPSDANLLDSHPGTGERVRPFHAAPGCP